MEDFLCHIELITVTLIAEPFKKIKKRGNGFILTDWGIFSIKRCGMRLFLWEATQ